MAGSCSHLPDHLEPELVAEPRDPLQLRQREGYLLLIHLRVVEDREGVDAHLQEQLEQAAEGLRRQVAGLPRQHAIVVNSGILS